MAMPAAGYKQLQTPQLFIAQQRIQPLAIVAAAFGQLVRAFR